MQLTYEKICEYEKIFTTVNMKIKRKEGDEHTIPQWLRNKVQCLGWDETVKIIDEYLYPGDG